MSSILSKLINFAGNLTGVLPIANGGTNKALTLAAGGLVWTDADSFEVGAAGTSSDWALSGGTGAPTFSSTTTTAKIVDGSADAIQMTIQGHSTQTSNILVVEKSDGTDLLQVTNVNGTNIRGTTTNDDAAAGFVGEIFESSQGSFTSMPGASGVNSDIYTLPLTAGDWNISFSASFNVGSATAWTRCYALLGTATGDNQTGAVFGKSIAVNIGTLTNTESLSSAIFRITASGATNYYFKLRTDQSTGTPQYTYYILARRVR